MAELERGWSEEAGSKTTKCEEHPEEAIKCFKPTPSRVSDGSLCSCKLFQLHIDLPPRLPSPAVQNGLCV